MAGPFQPYDDAQNRSSPSVGTPLSPSPVDGPVSFRKNVNRAKTKRWVEAKQYSYAGDDWGDDEYDEYDDTPPVPPPPHLNPSNAGASDSSKPAAVGMDRSQSMEQVPTASSVGYHNDGSRSADANTEPADSNAAFIPPADIYGQIQNQTDQQEQLQNDGRPDEASQHVGQSVPDPNSLPPCAPGVADGDDRGLHRPMDPTEGNPESEQFRDSANSIKARDVPVLGFPDVKRLSGSGADALGQSTTPISQPERPPLQHSNSAGFRSAVQQAFDVAEVPSSAVDSVARSNSDSTSVISPIIASRTVSEQKTPTIAEEPGDSSSQPVGTNQTIPFKPGHRRDLSLPSSDSTPSRKPEINLGEQGPPSANAEMSTPGNGSQQDYFQLSRPPMERSEFSDHGPHDDLPAPLRFGADAPTTCTSESNPPVDNPPVLVPSISCDAETSPEDTENDRLREEIIRSLSRENSPSSGPERDSRPTTRGDNLNPNDFDSSRSEGGRSAREPEADQPPVSRPKTFDEILGGAPAPVEQPKPRLTRRFSWESSSSEELPPPEAYQPPSQTPDYLGQPLPSEIAAQARSESVPEYSAIVNEEDAQSPVEKPKLTVIPPSTVDDNSVSDRLPEVFDDEAAGSVPIDSGAAARELVPITAPPPPVEPTLLGFRDILGIKSSNERVRGFNRTRDQFAGIDTGLDHWIRVTINAHPEHLDTLEQSLKQAGTAPKQSPSTRKFPKLPSLGNLASAPGGSLHVRRPSTHMMNRQQVEQRGKDLLHTAGMLGGRAGGAAKGFFAKGKSKFNRGGADKGQSSRRSLQLQDRSAVDPGGLGSCKRHSFHFRSLPGSLCDLDSAGRASLYDTGSIPSISSGLDSMPSVAGKADVSTAVLDARQQSSSPDAIPDRLQDPNTLDFEKELIAALRLDNSQAEQFVKLEFPSLLESPRTSLNSTVPTLENALSDSRTNELTREEISQSHVNPESTRSSVVLDPPHEPFVKIQEPCNLPDAEPRQSHESITGEGQESEELCPSRSLSYALNTAPSRSLSYTSNVTVVLASKAVRADEIRVLISGLPMTTKVEKFPALDNPAQRDNIPVEHAGLSKDAQESSHEGQPDGPTFESTDSECIDQVSEHPKESKTDSETGQNGPPVSSGHFPDENELRHIRSVSSLDTQETVQTFLPVSPPSEPAYPKRQSINGTDIAPKFNRRPESTAPSQPSPLRHEASPETSLSSEARSSILGSLGSLGSPGSGSLMSMDSMRVNPATSGNNLTILTAQVPEDHQLPRGLSAMDRLKNISRLRRSTDGPEEPGPHKRALSRLSVGTSTSSVNLLILQGLFGRSGQPSRSDGSSTNSYGDPNAYYSNSTRSGNGSNRSFRGQPPPPEGYFAPARTSQSSGHHLGAGSETTKQLPSPPLQYIAPYNQYPPRRSSMSPQPPQSATPPPTRKPDPPTRGRFYADNLRLRSRSPKHFAPHPHEKDIPTTDTSNPAYGLGIFRTQPTTSRTGDQERPWNVTIPEEANTKANSHASQRPPRMRRKPVPKPAIEESSPPPEQPEPHQTGPTHPHRGEARAINESEAPIELPVTKDDSSEEILMTSTAYPGQEWKPAGFGGWDTY